MQARNFSTGFLPFQPPDTRVGLDRMEVGAFIAEGAAGGGVDHALASLLGLLGLRVSEARNMAATRHKP